MANKLTHDRLMVLCFDIGKLPESVQFAILGCGALVTAIGFAFLQEMAYRVPGFKFGGFMALLTSWTFCVCAAIERFIRGETERRGTIMDYLLLSVFTAAGIYFTNWYNCPHINCSNEVIHHSNIG